MVPLCSALQFVSDQPGQLQLLAEECQEGGALSTTHLASKKWEHPFVLCSGLFALGKTVPQCCTGNWMNVIQVLTSPFNWWERL